MEEVRWIHYPRWRKPPQIVRNVVGAFEQVAHLVSSAAHNLKSNEVLGHVRPWLQTLGFQVEEGKGRVRVPVLFGEGGLPQKSFHADAHHNDLGVVVEVEAGRAYTNNQFLKDLFQACVMSEVHELVIAVRQVYRENKNYDDIAKFFETLYASPRLRLPLDGVTLVGY